MIARVCLGAGIDLRARAGPGKLEPKEPGTREPGAVVFSALTGSLLFAMALLEAESLSDVLKIVEPC